MVTQQQAQLPANAVSPAFFQVMMPILHAIIWIAFLAIGGFLALQLASLLAEGCMHILAHAETWANNLLASL